VKIPPLKVMASGAVLLGDEVACDGFHATCPVRAQTHVHLDHMNDFDRSKGFQDIYLTLATRRLLEAEMNADLPYRTNIVSLEVDRPRQLEQCSLTLVPSEHMLGSAQVLVELSSGMRVGYSGDFAWPMAAPIQVDGLVLDSTYGSPNNEREYTQGDAEEAFLRLVLERLRYGSVHVKSFRGTLQRALQILDGDIGCAVLGGERFIAEVDVYREFGYVGCNVTPIKSDEGREALEAGHYVQIYGNGDRLPVDPAADASTIVLSAYMSKMDDPVLVYSSRSFRVAMSNHADFPGTIDYVEATGAQFVVTDNTRGQGVELARELSARLNVSAIPSESDASYEWGV
jgi:putative mRNA 3-end processing factor